MTLWIDVTDLMAWRGHLTGIQRVVFNIASRAQRDGSRVKFFYYEPISHRFFEKPLDLSVWLQINNEQSKVEVVTIKNRIVNFVPHRVKRYTPKKAKTFAIKAGKLTLAQKRRFSEISKRRINNPDREVVFNKEDTVAVLGNGWDNQNIILDLGKRKQEQGFKLINVVYDLIPIFEPQFFGGMITAQYTNYMFETITNCDLLLPISKSTERDIYRFCDMIEAPRPKTTVIRLGDEVSDIESAIRPNWLRVDKFAICVGTIEVRKNHSLLYYAYKNLVNEGVEPPQLIIVGKQGWYSDDVMMLLKQDPVVSKYVTIAQNVSDDELVWLYQNCAFTIYPSLYEGWGLPVAESLARGKVALASSSSSVPEAGGKLADYFSPYDPIACSELIKKYFDSSLVEKKEKIILSTYKITTWEDTYSQIIKLLFENTKQDHEG